MQSFGIVGANTNKNGNFTIADMSKMPYHLLNLKEKTEPEATHQIYTDVDRWYWAAGYIEWLYNNSVYTGDGSGVFEPERNVMLSDVCAIALNLLGYTKFMESVNDDVVIDGARFRTNTDYSDYIGHCVKYYYDTEEEMLISALPYVTLDEAVNKLRLDEVIRYRMSNGEIRYIDTAETNEGFSALCGEK